MYYMSRRELNRKTTYIYKIILNNIKNKDFFNNEEQKRFFIEDVSVKSKKEKKRIISDCLVRALGFNDYQEYLKKTTYLKDINSLTKYQNLGYIDLKDIISDINVNLHNEFKVLNEFRIDFNDFFKEEINSRKKHLEYRMRNRKEDYKQQVLNGISCFYNELDSILPYGDFTIVEDAYDKIKLKNIVDRIITFSELKNEYYFSQWKSIQKRFNLKHPFSSNAFIKRITHTIQIEKSKFYIEKLNEKERQTFLRLLFDYEMWDLYYLITDLLNENEHPEYVEFLNLFNTSFYKNGSYINNEENLTIFSKLLIEKY